MVEAVQYLDDGETKQPANSGSIIQARHCYVVEVGRGSRMFANVAAEVITNGIALPSASAPKLARSVDLTFLMADCTMSDDSPGALLVLTK